MADGETTIETDGGGGGGGRIIVAVVVAALLVVGFIWLLNSGFLTSGGGASVPEVSVDINAPAPADS